MNTETLNYYGIVLCVLSFLIINFPTIAEHIIGKTFFIAMFLSFKGKVYVN